MPSQLCHWAIILKYLTHLIVVRPLPPLCIQQSAARNPADKLATIHQLRNTAYGKTPTPAWAYFFFFFCYTFLSQYRRKLYQTLKHAWIYKCTKFWQPYHLTQLGQWCWIWIRIELVRRKSRWSNQIEYALSTVISLYEIKWLGGTRARRVLRVWSVWQTISLYLISKFEIAKLHCPIQTKTRRPNVITKSCNLFMYLFHFLQT